MKKFWEMLSDDTGRVSSFRVCFVTWMLGVFLMVAWLTYVDGKFPEVPQSIVTLCGIAIAGKVGQSYTENKEGSSTPISGTFTGVVNKP